MIDKLEYDPDLLVRNLVDTKRRMDWPVPERVALPLLLDYSGKEEAPGCDCWSRERRDRARVALGDGGSRKGAEVS